MGRRNDGSAFRSGVLRLIGLLKKALPDCAEEDIFWGYHFVTGALMLTLAQTGRIDKLSGGLCKSSDYAAVKERMATFMAAGFLAVCERRKAERGPERALRGRKSCEYDIRSLEINNNRLRGNAGEAAKSRCGRQRRRCSVIDEIGRADGESRDGALRTPRHCNRRSPIEIEIHRTSSMANASRNR